MYTHSPFADVHPPTSCAFQGGDVCALYTLRGVVCTSLSDVTNRRNARRDHTWPAFIYPPLYIADACTYSRNPYFCRDVRRFLFALFLSIVTIWSYKGAKVLRTRAYRRGPRVLAALRMISYVRRGKNKSVLAAHEIARYSRCRRYIVHRDSMADAIGQ